MRIGIDVRYLSHGLIGGVRNYVAQFVPAVIEQAPGDQFFLYADTKRDFELDLAKLPGNVTLRVLPYRSPLSSAWLDFVALRRAMAADRLDLAHFPANYGYGPRGAKTVITLHDALNVMPLVTMLKGKGSRRTPKYLALSVYLHTCSVSAVRHAARLLTVSNIAKQDIVRFCNYPSTRIDAVPHAPPPGMQRVTDPVTLDDTRHRLGLPARFILADGLKNPAVIVRAWRRLPSEFRAERKIVFFARHEPLPVVHEAAMAGDACLLRRPSRADLWALFSMADVFVFPSWYEGFGIPILEAMVCGAPVIASDRYSIPEVVGNAALLADAEDDATFAKHLAAVLGSPSEAARLRALGQARASEFSWPRSAAAILHTYREALAA